MDREMLQRIAQQLRKPEGEMGMQVAEKMNSSNELMNHWSIQKLNLGPGDKILEIGMGNGLFVKDILSADASVKYTGCDYSPIMVAEALRINRSFVENGQAQFLVAEADKLPLADHSIKKAFTVNTIYFWSDPAIVLAEVRRVLKPGGLFIISIRPAEVMKNYPFTAYGFRLYDEEQLKEVLEENGFNVTETLVIKEPAQEIAGDFIEAESLIVCSLSS